MQLSELDSVGARIRVLRVCSHVRDAVVQALEQRKELVGRNLHTATGAIISKRDSSQNPSLNELFKSPPLCRTEECTFIH